jgi:gliding motility-associated-like protein
MKNLLYILLFLISQNINAFNPDLGTDTIYICSYDSTTNITPTVKGSEPFTFSYDDGWPLKDKYNVKPGLYDLSIWDSHNCGYVKHYQIIQLDPLIFDWFSNSPTCYNFNDGSFYYEITGGCPPYSVYMNGSKININYIYNLKSGTYNITIEDSKNCKLLTSVFIEDGKIKPFNNLEIESKCDELIIKNIDGDLKPYKLMMNGIELYTNVIKIQPDSSYNLTIIGYNGCSYDTVIPVKEIIEFSIDDINIKNPNCDLIQDGYIEIIESDNVIYSWDFTNNDTNKIDNLSPGYYSVNIKNLDNNCEIDYEFELEYENLSCLIVPNAFSPNGDGVHDTWEIENLELLYPNSKIWIYDRWGSLVYESIGYKKEWNGTNTKGFPLPTQSYHYIIEVNGGDNLVGQITILR